MHNGIIISGGCETRHNNIVYGLFYIWIPGTGLLHNRELPKTELNANECYDVFGSKDMSFKPIHPMKSWEIRFEGNMKLHNSNKFVYVSLKIDWMSTFSNCYKLDSDINVKALAKAIAGEQWSLEYFKKLKSEKQIRYEQFGKATGEMSIDNDIIKIETSSSYRDHSFGNVRDWGLIHHYVYFVIFLENDTNIVAGIISNPNTFSRLIIGVVNNQENYDTIRDITFEFDINEKKDHLKNNHIFHFSTEHETYRVKVDIMKQHTHYKGFESEAVLTQKFSRFIVNNTPGYGMFETHYNKNIHYLK